MQIINQHIVSDANQGLSIKEINKKKEENNKPIWIFIIFLVLFFILCYYLYKIKSKNNVKTQSFR